MYIYLKDILKLEQTKKDVLYLLMKLSEVSSPSEVKFKIDEKDQIKEKLLPNEKIFLKLTYTVKIPSDEFTKYGYGSNGKFTLKNWCLTPARFENHRFIEYNNLNLDDISNALSDFDIEFITPNNYFLSTDLYEHNKSANSNETKHILTGKNRLDFSIYLSKKNDFFSFKNDDIEAFLSIYTE